MPTIPENQLDTWSHQGAVATAKATHEVVRRALTASNSMSQGPTYEVFLQGSYADDTNTRGDSDVDVVVQLNGSFLHNASDLPGPAAGHVRSVLRERDKEAGSSFAPQPWPHCVPTLALMQFVKATSAAAADWRLLSDRDWVKAMDCGRAAR